MTPKRCLFLLSLMRTAADRLRNGSGSQRTLRQLNIFRLKQATVLIHRICRFRNVEDGKRMIVNNLTTRS